MYFLKENFKPLLIIFAISIILPIILLTPSNIGIFSKETSYQILSYCGSILGGFLTLYGVWWTIRDQNEKRKMELAIQYSPVFNTYIHVPLIKDDSLVIKFDIKNIGRGEVLSGSFDKEEVNFYGSHTFNSKIIDYRKVYIPINEVESFHILIKQINDKDSFDIKSSMIFSCTDIFNNKIRISINIKLQKEGNSYDAWIAYAPIKIKKDEETLK